MLTINNTKRLIIILFLSILINNSFAQTINSYTYTAFNGVKYNMRAVEKKNVVVLLPITWTIISEIALDTISERIDRMYEYYKISMGFEPGGGLSQYSNKCSVAFVNETCGAACGRIGSKGVEIGLGYIDNMQNEFLDQSTLCSIGLVSYEFGRNFFTSSISSKLSFSNNTMAFANGYATFMGIMAAFYSGAINDSNKRMNETNYWYNELYSHFLAYLTIPAESAENLFLNNKLYDDRYRLPRGQGLFKEAAVFAFLEKNFREYGIFPSFWSILRNQPNGSTNQQVFDNIAVSTSLATNLNLSSFFINTLKFKLSETALNQISKLSEPVSSKLIRDIEKFDIVNIDTSLNILTSNLIPQKNNSINKIKIFSGDKLMVEDTTSNTTYKLNLSKYFSKCDLPNDKKVLIQNYMNNTISDEYSLTLHFADTLKSSIDLIKFSDKLYLYSGNGTGSAIVDTKENAIKLSRRSQVGGGNLLYFPLHPVQGHSYTFSAWVKASAKASLSMGVGCGLGSGYLPYRSLNDSTKYYKLEQTFKLSDFLNDSIFFATKETLVLYVAFGNESNSGEQWAYFKDFQLVDNKLSEEVWNTKPNPPNITKNLNQLVSSALIGNQWYYNNELIPNANNYILYPDKPGLYSVSTTMNNCTSELSLPIDFQFQNIKMYPNPVIDLLKVESQTLIENIEIFNTMGKIMSRYTNSSFISYLNFSSFSKGIYIVKIKTGDGTKSMIILKN